MPDDGRRQEIIDGVLIVTRSPGLLHQRVVVNLRSRLRDACPAAFEVLPGPFTVGLADDTELRPDLLVAQRDQLAQEDLPAPPVLAVEVLAPSTRTIDIHVKRERFERAATRPYPVSVIPADLVR